MQIVAAPTKRPQELFLQIGRKRYQVASIADAQAKYEAARDASGFGASQMPRVTITDRSGSYLATVMYNGRVMTTDGNAQWVEVAA